MPNGYEMLLWLAMTSVAGFLIATVHDVVNRILLMTVFKTGPSDNAAGAIKQAEKAINKEETIKTEKTEKTRTNDKAEMAANHENVIKKACTAKKRKVRERRKVLPEAKTDEEAAGIVARAMAAPDLHAGKKNRRKQDKPGVKFVRKNARTVPDEEKGLYVLKNGVIQLQDSVKLREEARNRELAEYAKRYVDDLEECERRRKVR